ncbi:hypothetical protein H4W30_003729 [Amycolatopsis roodepoortensis]|uniref:Uncharacterized protein n=1 Tax=Amycolatopsis roodepoortensis TaxID=700274 RepID=A0ABR9L807_9PSEU|nr:hypothetical protein [Amycolatopsis roodepoortensis]
MVVPGRDHRVTGVQPLEVFVGLVHRVALPVVPQGDQLVGRYRGAEITCRVGIPFVEVVTQVNEGVEVVTVGQTAVGGEVTDSPVGTRDHAEPQARDVLVVRRRGTCPPGRRDLPLRREAVPIRGRRAQPARGHLHRVVAFRSRPDVTASDDARESGVFGHLPPDADRRPFSGSRNRVRRGGDAGPEEHRIGHRIARRHPVRENRGLRPARCTRKGECRRCSGGGDPGRAKNGSPAHRGRHGMQCAVNRRARDDLPPTWWTPLRVSCNGRGTGPDAPRESPSNQSEEVDRS